MDIKEVISKLEASFKKHHGACKYEEALIVADLDDEIMCDIADYYIAKGWKFIYFKNLKYDWNYDPNVKPTCKFILSNEELDNMDSYTMIS
jgi:hypothetical protein